MARDVTQLNQVIATDVNSAALSKSIGLLEMLQALFGGLEAGRVATDKLPWAGINSTVESVKAELVAALAGDNLADTLLVRHEEGSQRVAPLSLNQTEVLASATKMRRSVLGGELGAKVGNESSGQRSLNSVASRIRKAPSGGFIRELQLESESSVSELESDATD